jgi:hypothetical protein
VTNIVPHEAQRLVPTPSDDEIGRMYRIAKALALSGMFKDARQAEQAFALIVIGRDLGLSPAQSMTGIHIVEGKPMLHYAMLGSFVRAHADYDFRVVEHTNDACAIEFLRGEEVIGTSRFTMQDAKTAGLGKPSRNGQPSNWVKFPRNMLYARAMSNGVRFYCPDALGGIPVYVEDEIIDSTAQDLTVGEGSGADEHVVLPPQVEAVIARAKSQSHAGLANRAAAAMAVGGQPMSVVEAWCRKATGELNRLAAERPVEAVCGPEAPETTTDTPEAPDSSESPASAPETPRLTAEDAERLTALRDRAHDLLEDATYLDAEGDDDRAAMAREEAELLMGQVEAAANPDQDTLDI